MLAPLLLLAIGAVFSGYLFKETFIGHHSNDFWQASIFFLNPVKHRSNLVIRTQTQVEKLAMEKSPTEGWRCAGAWVVDGATNRRYAVGARTSVILSAGSIGSVQLLECSGIGDPAVLAQAGVEPLVNLPGVGENLQDHLQIRAVFSVKGVKTLNTMARPWVCTRRSVSRPKESMTGT